MGEDKLVAMDQVLGDLSLAPIDRLILMQMIKHAGTDHVCALSKTSLAEYCGTSRGAVRTAINKLKDTGYLITMNPNKGFVVRYIPYPYCVNLIQSSQTKSVQGRLTISPDDSKFVLALLAEKEVELTLLSRDADERRDILTKRRALTQMDRIFELKDTFERFVKRSEGK